MTKASEYERNIQSFQWDDLKRLWGNICDRNTLDWEAGKAFEYLILRAFQLDGADVTWPYSVKLFNEEIEQIDGAIYYDGLSCLVESKDFADNTNVDIAPIAKLRNQLLRRPANTIGVVFSRTGFTSPARYLSSFALPQTILLWSGKEIEYALQEEKICEFFKLKYRYCVEHGLPNYNIKEDNIP